MSTIVPLRERDPALSRGHDDTPLLEIADLSVEFATGDQIGRLIADDRVQGVALTGSEGAGSIVAANAGKNLKKSVMELGGSDVFVVLDDADVDKAVAAGVEARLRGCGQVCNGAKRFLVHEKVADEFLKKFVEQFTNTKIGDPMDESVGLGPMASVGARNDIAAQVERAVKAGAKVLVGGAAIDGPGAFYAPTILTDVSRDNPAYFEEFFGPVAQVHIVRSDEEVVNIANDSNFGLSGAIFTADIERAKALLRRGDLSVTDVCMAVGCTSLGSFSSRFTELVGESPSAYRSRDHEAAAAVPGCVSMAHTRPSRIEEAPAAKTS